MHAFLLTGVDSEKISLAIVDTTLMLGAKSMEYPVKKIEDVRQLGKFVNLTVSGKTAILIKDIDMATEEAQNALLKNLEEPQDNLNYILTASSEEAVVPTIISRCEVVRTGGKEEISDESLKDVRKFYDSSGVERLLITSKITTREEASLFMKNLILAGRELMKKDLKMVNFLEAAEGTLISLRTNGNVQLQLTNFVIRLVN